MRATNVVTQGMEAMIIREKLKLEILTALQGKGFKVYQVHDTIIVEEKDDHPVQSDLG